MSFLESIQHGLEKASQQAARITRIQHLHHIATDLDFKASQQGQNLVGKAMEMYHNGILAQGELTAICKQIADYQQQSHEVQEELQRLQSDEDGQQEIPAPPAPAPGYQVYPQAAPAQAYPAGPVPPGYPAYPTPPAGYPPYPPQASYPAAPGLPVQQPAYAPPPASTRPPTQPLSLSSETPTAPGAPAQASAPPAHPHKAAAHHHAAPAPAAESDQSSAPPPGTYANGALPPIYSPFAQSPATSAPAEPEHPAKAHRSTKKAAPDADTQEK